MRALARMRLAAIGAGTAEELARFHLQADLIPKQFRAESLADALCDQASGKRFLLARASRGRELLAERLREAGAVVEQIVVYNSVDVPTADEEIARRVAEADIDWITVTSSAIARSLAKMFGQQLHNCRLASISPVTTATMHELGFDAAAQADPHTMAGLVDAIQRGSGGL